MIMLTMLLAAAAVQDPAVPSEVHVFTDWAVACDNGRRCQAVSLQPEGAAGEQGGVMMIERGPESDAALSMSLAQIEGVPARLMVYGEALPARLSGADGDYEIEPQDHRAFMERVIYGEAIDLQDSAAAVVGRVSLKGLSGAMLYMDEVQGRLHTPTALVRTGRLPASQVPSPPVVPTVRIAAPTSEAPLDIPAARITQLRRDAECTIGEVGGPDEAETAALGGGRTLVLLACGSGAYNVTSIPFIATRDGRTIRIEAARFDTLENEADVAEDRRFLVNAEWDPAEMTLGDFSKGRGLGDCGSRSRYGWDGARFRLLAQEEMPECRGSYTYVTTWRTEVRR